MKASGEAGSSVATMPEAFIVDAVRTPVGRRGGSLSTVHPADLGAHAIAALIERTGVDEIVASEHDILDGIAWSLA